MVTAGRLKVYEVGLRDGLQNQSTLVSTEGKLQLAARLRAAGVRHFEATSFVNPKAVPQMADALGIAEANQRQWIITSYLLGFGTAQIVYATLADRFGRRPVLLFGLVVYIASSIAAFTSMRAA